MKKITTLLLFFTAGSCFAQINLEHSYPNSWNLVRTTIDGEGEKYYYLDLPNRKIELFNGDHTPWKTIVLNLPPGDLPFFAADNFSSTYLNSDPYLEFSLFYYLNNNFVSTYWSELGQPVFPEAGNVVVVNGHYKYVTPNGKVYSLPGYTLEYTYPQGYVNLAYLDTGVKYFTSTGLTTFTYYNEDHSIWKNVDINIPIDSSCYIASVNNISHKLLNLDDNLEFLYRIICPDSLTTEIVNDQSEVLFSHKIANTGYIPAWGTFSSNNGALSKDYFVLYVEDGTEIYDLPEFTLHAKYVNQPIGAFYTDLSVGKFAEFYVEDGTDHLSIYNEDGSVWKEIPVNPAGITSLEDITQHLLNTDDDVEIFVAKPPSFQIINELGSILFQISDYPHCYLSNPQNLSPKYICSRGPDIGSTGNPESRVYSFGPVSDAFEAATGNFSARIYPNPAADFIQVQIQSNAIGGMISLLNVSGECLVQQQVEGPVSDVRWPPGSASGLYFLKLQIGDKTSVIRVIKK